MRRNTPEPTSRHAGRTISVVLPLHLLARLDAHASGHGDRSDLIRAALYDLVDDLDRGDRSALDRAVVADLVARLTAATGTSPTI